MVQAQIETTSFSGENGEEGEGEELTEGHGGIVGDSDRRVKRYCSRKALIAFGLANRRLGIYEKNF